MSRSFGVKILLPMDQYNSDEVYAADERLEKDSSDKEDGKYYKTLKIRSTYASTNDIRAYLMENMVSQRRTSEIILQVIGSGTAITISGMARKLY